MPRVPPLDRPATYEDLLALPDNLVAEIVGGELHASARPASPHATVAARLTALLGPRFDLDRPGPDGWWILQEPELHLAADVVVPDLAGWRRPRMPAMPHVAFFTLAPDWLCEILSPSTVAFDRGRKLTVYAREGVSHAWLIDPIARTLEVLSLRSGAWLVAAAHAGDEVVRAAPFADIEIPLVLLWGGHRVAAPG